MCSDPAGSAPTAALVAELRERGVALWPADGGLGYEVAGGALAAADRAVLRARRDEVLGYLRASGAGAPATVLEERIWLACLATPPGAYIITCGLDITGPAEPGLLARAWLDVCARHPALRTGFHAVDSVVARRVAMAGRPAVVSHVTPAAWPERAAALAAGPATGQLPLNGEPLAALTIVTDGTRHRAWLAVHHLIFDGVSARVVLADLADAYERRRRGAGTAGPAGPAGPTTDQALAALRRRARQVRPADTAYWAGWLARLAREPVFGAAHGHGPAGGVAGTDIVVPPAQCRVLAEAAARCAATPVMLLLAALAITLRTSPGTDTVLAVPISVRDLDIGTTVGAFSVTVPVAWRVREDASTAEVLRHIRDELLAALDHVDGTLTGLRHPDGGTVSWAQLPMEVLVSHDEGVQAPPPIGGAQVAVLAGTPIAARCPLTIVATGPTGAGLQVHLESDPALGGTAWLQSLAEALAGTLARLAADPDGPAGACPRAPAPASAARTAPSVPTTAADYRDQLDRVRTVWAEVLEIPAVDADATFFDLGGTSAQLMEMHSRLIEVSGTAFDIVDLFRYPTARGLAGRLAGERPAEVGQPGPGQAASRQAASRQAASRQAASRQAAARERLRRRASRGA